MKTTGKFKKTASFILAVIMFATSFALVSFAAEDDFEYDYADDTMTEVVISKYKGTVPDDGVIVIPDTLGGRPVVGIGERAFANLDKLTKIVIPETVVTIDDDAFKGCPNVVDIEYKGNDEVDMGQGVFDATQWYEDHKQDYVFAGTTLVSYKGSDEIVAVPYNCTAIADGAFQGNAAIKTVYIEKELKKIGENAFNGCTSLTDVYPGNGIGDLTVGKDAFAGTPWLENFPSTLVIIGTTLIKYKGDASYVSIPNLVTTIADGAFYQGDYGKDLAFKVKIPTSVKNIGNDPFFLYNSASKVYPEILVYKDSEAEKYCQSMGLNYKYALLPGDLDGSEKITAADARIALRVSAKLEFPIENDEIKEAADINGDAEVAADDARLILRISANLTEYSLEQLLSMPRTDYEVLLLASRAVSLAGGYGCAYSKLSYGSADVNMSYHASYVKRFLKDGLSAENKAKTETYAQGSEDAEKNFFAITLIDPSMIKEYSCSVDDEGLYNIRIVLNDEKFNCTDTEAASKTGKMFPVQSVSYFTNGLAKKYWGKNITYDMTYTDCALDMQVDVDSLMLKNITLTMNYDFTLAGKILALNVKNGGDPATARRTEVVKYTNFEYFGDSTPNGGATPEETSSEPASEAK